MGRDVSNFIVMMSDKIDVDRLLKEYLDSILDIDDKDPNRLMVYGDDYSDKCMSKFLGEDKFKEVRDRKYISFNNSLLFFAETRKCDLKETFKKFIEPYLDDLETCMLFQRCSEDGHDLYENDLKFNNPTWYYDSDLPGSFYYNEYGEEEFIVERCGLDIEIPSIDMRW